MNDPALRFQSLGFGARERLPAGEPACLGVVAEQTRDIVFELDASLDIYARSSGERVHSSALRRCGVDASWLPRASYRLHWMCPALNLASGDYVADVCLWHLEDGAPRIADRCSLDFSVEGDAQGEVQGNWTLSAGENAPELSALSWRKGPSDWFYKHFDHAARTVMSYMLGDSPLLKGRILDVGCGDGITDLGIALRAQPELLIGIDPFRGFDRLPQILESNHFPVSAVPDCLRFEAADANHLPFEDDSFDVVLSWGSLEHIVGGYTQALREIKRVLRPDGLLFVHPGLFYSNIGHHLGEFSPPPFAHLEMERDQLREFVLSRQPQYIDRSGEFSSPEQYWQWFTELNPISVSDFERQLRDLDFEFWRVAMRACDRVDYTPRLQPYRFEQLCVDELYVSARNRKPARPVGLQRRKP